MVELMRAGGWVMIFVLLFGGLTLAAAAWFAYRPEERHVGTIRALSSATVFSVLAGVFADFGAVFTKVPGNPEWAHDPDLPLIVMTGLGESMAPGILGFSMLALAWFVTAVGVRRLAHVDRLG